MQRIASLLPLTMLIALAALQTLTSARHLAVDARIAGIAVAVIAIWRRAPFLVVVALATVVTAVVRHVT